MPHRKWLVNRTNREYIEYLSRAASISPAMAQVLVNRGIKTPSEAKDFLNSGCVSDPLDMAGVREAVEAIRGAKSAGVKVFVHGDYDVDGVTATAIMVSGLRALGLDTSYYIPNRFTHGYGFGPHAVALAKEAGAGLIITVDCGITSFEACALARKEGLGVIITDHHEGSTAPDGSKPVRPEAIAVINPKLEENAEGQALSGAGVALKVIEALGLPREEFLDLAALGTIADVVPLIGENRAIVKEGTVLMVEGKRQGLKALSAVSGLNGQNGQNRKSSRPGNLSFTLIPRINAAGRLAEASVVVELLLTDSEERAMEIARSLDRLNSERQKTEEAVLDEALGLLDKKGVYPAIVLAGEGWHEGVVGIVAARLAERNYRPAFVLSIKGDVAKGSARSIPEFDIHKGLSAVRDTLVGFGGHRQAAGLKVDVSKLGEFEERICRAVEEEVSDFTPTLMVDADIGIEEVSFGLAKEVSMLEPFGSGNPEPLFGSRGVEMINPRIVGNNHLKARLKGVRASIDAIGFDMGGILEGLDSATVDAVYAATVNEWEGGRTLQLNLKALRPALKP